MDQLPYMAYVGLGSNLPWQGHAPERTLPDAMVALRALGEVVALSSLWRTAPVGPILDQPEFVNAAAALRANLYPEALLAGLRELEARFGRTRIGPAKGPRTLDLDLLLMEDATGAPVLRSGAELTLPHPEMHQRRFVLGPLAEIAPELRHPELGKTVREMLQKAEGGGGPA